MQKFITHAACPKKLVLAAAIAASTGFNQFAVAQQQQQIRLEEVIVTAQKRVQSVQDIPVAVTALTQEVMEVNNVIDVNDLNGLAPNMSVRPSVGGVNIPTFNMRGITSIGVVAGSDKQISIYLDGVYIGAPRGSIFTLPDIQQLEVLRGPQGTLFGRNATGGAISIRTRDPAGEFNLYQKVTVGNRDLLGTETTIDFPSVGPFSAYLTYAKEERDGDIKNSGRGQEWDRTGFGYGRGTSPATLGAINNENVFFSSFLDLGDVTISYKFDYATDEGTPRGNVVIGDPSPALAGAINSGVIDALDQLAEGNGTSRPKSYNNAWVLDREQKIQGHNIYLEWEMNDEWTLKNTLAFRQAEVFAPADIGGSSGWQIFGNPFCLACSQADADGHQWSNELQFDYDGDWATIITGVLYYTSEDRSGSPYNSLNVHANALFPGGVVPRSAQSISYNEGTSYAVYSQADIHITEELDLLLGVRYTEDDKEGYLRIGLPDDPPSARNPDGGYEIRVNDDYKDDNIDYLIGLNYQLNESILVYGKYSTAFVSGGTVASIGFEKEESKSWELGAKADFFDSRLRANIAVFDVVYENLQGPSSAAALDPDATDPDFYEETRGLATFIVGGGELEAEGVELELTALPAEGLVLGATVGYVNPEHTAVNPLTYNGDVDEYVQTNIANWSGNLSLNYETEPLFDNAYMTVGLTGLWTQTVSMQANPNLAKNPLFRPGSSVPEHWIFNARMALKDVEFGGGWSGEVGLWGRNLTDEDNISSSLNFGGALVAGTFQEARSYGIDIVVNFK